MPTRRSRPIEIRIAKLLVGVAVVLLVFLAGAAAVSLLPSQWALGISGLIMLAAAEAVRSQMRTARCLAEEWVLESEEVASVLNSVRAGLRDRLDREFAATGQAPLSPPAS